MASRLKGTNSDPRVPCENVDSPVDIFSQSGKQTWCFFDRFKQQTYAKDEALLDMVMGIYNKDTTVLTFAQHKLKHRQAPTLIFEHGDVGMKIWGYNAPKMWRRSKKT